MADFSAPTPGTGERMSFFNVMVKAYTGPSQTNFQSLARSSGASTGTAYLWVAIAAAIGSLIGAVLSQIFKFNPLLDYLGNYGFEDYGFGAQAAGGFFNIVTTLVCGVPVAVVLAVIVFAIATGILHLISGLLGGHGEYKQLAYLLAAVQVPFSLFSAIISPIPYLGCLAALVGIYVLVLQVLALDGVYAYGIPKAILTLLVPFIVICLVVACITIASLTLLAPVFKDIFNQIQNGIYP